MNPGSRRKKRTSTTKRNVKQKISQKDERCGEIFMTKDRTLMFQCEKCSVKTNSFEELSEHLKEHWPDYIVKESNNTHLEFGDQVTSKNDTKVDKKSHGVESSKGIWHKESDEPTDMIEYHLEENFLDTENEDNIQNLFDESIKEKCISIRIDPLGENDEIKKRQIRKQNSEAKCAIKKKTQQNKKVEKDLYAHLTPEERVKAYIEESRTADLTKCNKCSMIFQNNHRLKIHEKTHTDERKYKCPHCGFAFKEEYNLRVHLRRHFGKKRFKCEYCPKMFITRSELLTHERRHTGERPFICSECGLGFVSSGSLKLHSKRHSGVREHICKVCSKDFIDPYQLKDHMIVHTAEKNHVCEVCNASFSRLKSLRVHFKLHENKREYVCSICNAAFNQKPSLTMHLKNTHKVLNSKPARLLETEPLTKIVNEPKSTTMTINNGVPTCERCHKGFPNMAQLVMHIEKLHAGEPIVIDWAESEELEILESEIEEEYLE